MRVLQVIWNFEMKTTKLSYQRRGFFFARLLKLKEKETNWVRFYGYVKIYKFVRAFEMIDFFLRSCNFVASSFAFGQWGKEYLIFFKCLQCNTLGLISEPSIKSLNSLNVQTGPARIVL